MLKKSNFIDLGLTSPPGENEVDGVPPAFSLLDRRHFGSVLAGIPKHEHVKNHHYESIVCHFFGGFENSKTRSVGDSG